MSGVHRSDVSPDLILKGDCGVARRRPVHLRYNELVGEPNTLGRIVERSAWDLMPGVTGEPTWMAVVHGNRGLVTAPPVLILARIDVQAMHTYWGHGLPESLGVDALAVVPLDIVQGSRWPEDGVCVRLAHALARAAVDGDLSVAPTEPGDVAAWTTYAQLGARTLMGGFPPPPVVTDLTRWMGP